VGDNVLVKAQTQGSNPSIAKSIVFLRQWFLCTYFL
jgi:hypothetical protein